MMADAYCSPSIIPKNGDTVCQLHVLYCAVVCWGQSSSEFLQASKLLTANFKRNCAKIAFLSKTLLNMKNFQLRNLLTSPSSALQVIVFFSLKYYIYVYSVI